MVAMIDIDDLLPAVLRYAPTCPEPILVDALRTAAIDVCKAGREWNEQVTQVIDGTEQSVPIDAPDSASVITITASRFAGAPLKHVTLRWLDEHYPNWRTDTAGQVRFLSQDNPDTITLYPVMAGTLVLDLTLKPAIGAAEVPSFLNDHHRDPVGWGAAATVMMVPGQSYSNPQLGQFYAAQFDGHLAMLRTRQPMGQTRAMRRSTGRYF